MTNQVSTPRTAEVIQLTKNIRSLIPDLLPPDHMSLQMKRIKFIQGQGVVLYDNSFVVEIFTPLGGESPAYFGVFPHHGDVAAIHDYYRKPEVLRIDDPRVSSQWLLQFEEAVMQFLPLAINEQGWVVPHKSIQPTQGREIQMHNNLSGAA